MIDEQIKKTAIIEFSAKGGKTTLKRHGKDHYARAGRKGYESKIAKDPDYFKKLAQKREEAKRIRKAQLEAKIQEDQLVKPEKKKKSMSLTSILMGKK